MKALYRVLPIVFFAGLLSAETEEVGIGQEYIKSSRFPKFSITTEYATLRSGRFLGEKDISSKIKPNWGGGLAFDVGLKKYLNAGAGFSVNVGQLMAKSEPIFARFTIFAKPIYSINDRISLFSRIGAGLSVMFLNPLYHFRKIGSSAIIKKLGETYGEQHYGLVNPGVNAMATVGAEFFPWSRFGIALEWGVRTDILYSAKSNVINNLLGNRPGRTNAPNSIKYLGFDMPLTLTLHVIL